MVYRRVSPERYKLTCLKVTFLPRFWQDIVWPRLTQFLKDLHQPSFTDSEKFFDFLGRDTLYFSESQMEVRAKELWGLLKNKNIELSEEVFSLESFFKHHGIKQEL